MSNADFNRLSEFIYTDFGIKLPPAKKIMLESRLQKRLKALQLNSYKEYCDLIFSPQGQQEELIQMIDLVTTNTTHFFREPAHFDFLHRYVLPEYNRSHTNKTLQLWSAGCSSGEEPYTLAMVLKEHADGSPLPDFNIFASDISSHVLQKAVKAVYSEDKIANIPLNLRKKYFLRSKDRGDPTVRLNAMIRSKVQFSQLNFMDNALHTPHDFDIIFCRNVLIYFDKVTQEKVIARLCQRLRKGGFFFLGHSESITGMKLPLEQLKPTVFRRI
jgi:chemotaxis protein methyltransferase CheR